MTVERHGRRHAHALAAILLLCLVVSACGRRAAEEIESEGVVPVKTDVAVTGSIRGVVHATGTVAAAPGAELVVVAPAAARIAEIPRAEGEAVRRGDVLVRFEVPDVAAEVARQAAEVQRSEARLANARAGQDRAHDLFDRGVAARKEVEDADREVADAEAAVAQAEAGRTAATAIAARSVVRATFDAIVAKRYHNPGDLVDASASDPVLRVFDPRRLEVVASVPLGDAPRIAMGATARLVDGAGSGAGVLVRVVSRPAAVEVGTATIPVRLGFVVPTGLAVGTPVQVEIEAEEHSGVVLIPAAALVREAEETAVFVAAGDRAERRPVRIGLMDGQRIEILAGLEPGERVIVDSPAGLPDGAAITTGAIAGQEGPPGAAGRSDAP